VQKRAVLASDAAAGLLKDGKHKRNQIMPMGVTLPVGASYAVHSIATDSETCLLLLALPSPLSQGEKT
jgi:hypothetical protein